MTPLEQSLADLGRSAPTQEVKLWAARELLNERRHTLAERRSTRLLWLLAVVGVANLISAAAQVARMAVCP